MATISSLIISLLLMFLCVASAWWTKQLKARQIAIVFGVSLLLWLLGAAFLLPWYPWTSIVDLIMAISAGLLLGRALPAKFYPFLIFLLVLSTLDIVQVLLSTHGAPPTPKQATIPAGQFYSTFLLQLPWGNYRLGPADMLLFATIGVYWCKRHSTILVACSGLAIALLVTYTVLLLKPLTLPLIPFLLLGWLCSVAWEHYSAKTPPIVQG